MLDPQWSEGLIGKSFAGYRVTEFVARGGMGVVFKGIQESLNRPVAIKFLYPHLSTDDSFRSRFEREARSSAALSHPNIVRVLDFGQESGLHYMVLDFVDGESLRDYLARLHRDGLSLRTDRAIRILEQISSALDYAHEQGFVHRDVKPGNILLTRDGHALLTDFGVVKLVEGSQVTVAGSVIGTPEYIAPEQTVDATTIGPAADQYALGIVAYEMLTGRVPFKSQTPTAVLNMHVTDPPPPPSTIAPGIPPETEAVLLIALAKHPADRHENARTFVERLSQSISDSMTMAGAAASSGTAWSVAPGNQATAANSPPPPPAGTPPASATVGSGDGSGGSRSMLPWLLAGGLGILLLLALGAAGVLLLRDGGDGDDDGDVAGIIETATAIAEADETPTERPTIALTPIVLAPTATAVAEATPTEAGPVPTDTGGAADATPTEEPTAGLVAPDGMQAIILFTANRGGVHDSQIFVMNPDGSDQRQITFARGHSWGPRVSPDGSTFFFSSVAPGDHEDHSASGGGTEGSGNHDVYVANADGSAIENITAGFLSWDNGWSWSPDGELITFTSDREGNWDLYTMTPDGENIDRITDSDDNEGWPSWTPDGEQIVFTSDESGTSEIYIMDADGSNVRQLTDRPDTFDTYPFISPDGEKIVFSSQTPEVLEGEIYVMDIDGGNVTRLTSTAALNYAPSWSPDGSQIVFVSDRDGNANIYIMDADGSNQTRLTDDPGEDTTPVFAFIQVS